MDQVLEKSVDKPVVVDDLEDVDSAKLSLSDVKTTALTYANAYDFKIDHDLLVRGALVAMFDLGKLDCNSIEMLDELAGISPDERAVLEYEKLHRWSHPWTMYMLAACSSLAAAVQGMDESVINGALLYFPKQFGIGNANSERDNWIQGIVASVPYLACAIPGCWLTPFLNRYLGRRGTICFTAAISGISCIWQGVTNSWAHLLVARLVMGLGIGPKSATTPMYTAECAPRLIRGALVMQWQVWTAFGFVIGYLSTLGLMFVPDLSGIEGLNWRLMLGIACVPAFIVMLQVYFCPESPRWLLRKGKAVQAFRSFCRLRSHPIQAARDFYLAHVLLKAEKDDAKIERFSSRRNINAFIAVTILMLGQPFCGVNTIAFYSGTVLSEAGLSNVSALLGSFGYGFLCFASSIPAWFTIDTFGRRRLILFTLPFLLIFLLITGSAFHIDDKSSRVGVVLLGIYLFASFYGPGMGPVPFTYTAEAFPLSIREFGMAYGTAILWLFNGILSLTWFRMRQAFTTTGGFGFYAGLCLVLWVLTFLFVPETKVLTLEELDAVFSRPVQLSW